MPAKKTATKKTAPEKEAVEVVETEVINNKEETAPEKEADTTPEETREVSEALVYNRHQNLMRVFRKEDHGEKFIELAYELAEQPRRQGWKVVVR